LALVTEGGYELTALAACLEASFAAIDANDDSTPAGASLDRADRARGDRAAAAARTALRPYWRSI
jgi:hypothetical protein